MQRSIEHQLQARVGALEAEVKNLRMMMTHQILQVVPEAISLTSTLQSLRTAPIASMAIEVNDNNNKAFFASVKNPTSMYLAVASLFESQLEHLATAKNFAADD
ncbi:hypothetical protein TI39_contig623g00007 [Zymoseptoria brevis]|uniref:Uncharacterized protein n=1 Tax=Zymoseptoria brevis TaxID=1047168 RepID=A0A0F4GGA5_9PEZI|nr:hypothetical protein TI39_contig623g00007 [Zymoseptoria brevis]